MKPYNNFSDTDVLIFHSLHNGFRNPLKFSEFFRVVISRMVNTLGASRARLHRLPEEPKRGWSNLDDQA